MNILYKSSGFQTYTYFFIYPLIIGICIFVILGIISYGDFGLFNLIILTILSYALITSVESIISLKYIKVTDECVLYKTFGEEKRLEYKDIVYIYNLVNYKEAHIIIWHNDNVSGKLKVILTRPERENLFLIKNYKSFLINNDELPITKYIRERAEKENPEYLRIDNKRWFLFTISPTFKIF